LLLGLVLVWAAGAPKVKTKAGLILLEDVPANAAVELDGITVANVVGGGQPVRITAPRGTHNLLVKRGDFVLWRETVTVESAKEYKLTVRTVPDKNAVLVLENLPTDFIVEIDGERTPLSPSGAKRVEIKSEPGKHVVVVKQAEAVLLAEAATLERGVHSKLSVPMKEGEQAQPPTSTLPRAQTRPTPAPAPLQLAEPFASPTAEVPKPREQQIALGKAQILESFTCQKCGTTFHQFPVALHAEDLGSLDDDCRVHIQSSRCKDGQETGTLDKTNFSWIANGATSRSNLVDVREIIRAEDLRFDNHNEWARVFVLRDTINRFLEPHPVSRGTAPRGTKPTSKVINNFPSDLVGKFAWIETKFLTQVRDAKAFRIVDDEVYFGEVHFPHQKVQQFWGMFCEEYAKIEGRVSRSKYKEFMQAIDKTLADTCGACGIFHANRGDYLSLPYGTWSACI
jgi:hypothetical protein